MSESNRPIPPTTYSKEYFLTECDGYAEYLESGGASLTQRLRALEKFLSVRPGMKVLDVGCGRGEMIVHCAMNGTLAVGIDYSKDALGLAQQAITLARDQNVETWITPYVSASNAKHLPFADGVFDRVIMSDIVEHLYPGELWTALEEIYRVLALGGELLIHTMPNLWYYCYGYPLFRLVQRLRGVSLPVDPRERFCFSHVHVNEQTPHTLGKAMSSIGFSYWRVWLYDYREYTQYSPAMRYIMRLLTRLPIVKQIFCDDIFGAARK